MKAIPLKTKKDDLGSEQDSEEDSVDSQELQKEIEQGLMLLKRQSSAAALSSEEGTTTMIRRASKLRRYSQRNQLSSHHSMEMRQSLPTVMEITDQKEKERDGDLLAEVSKADHSDGSGDFNHYSMSSSSSSSDDSDVYSLADDEEEGFDLLELDEEPVEKIDGTTAAKNLDLIKGSPLRKQSIQERRSFRRASFVKRQVHE
jgi:hypothetical protein